MQEGYYGCDCGSVGVKCGDNLILYPNGLGDGGYNVYEFESEEEFNSWISNEHKRYFISAATFRGAKVLEYDCDINSREVFELNGRYGIYCYNGEVYFVKWED